MPVVFVHGVNTRKGPAYDAGTLVIDAFVRKYLSTATIGGRALAQPATTFPYWGDLGMTFAFNMASLPRPQMQALGGTADVVMQNVLGHVRDAFPQLPAGEPLTALAKKRLPLAVDAINHLALRTVAPGDEQAVAAFVVAASAYAEANPQPAWLAQVQSDQDLLNQLAAQIQAHAGVQALGGFGAVFNKIKASAVKLNQAVKNAAGKAIDKAGDFASTKLLAWHAMRSTKRSAASSETSSSTSTPEATRQIPERHPEVVFDAFDAARAAAPNEPLVVIGHSLGGVISFDLLSPLPDRRRRRSLRHRRLAGRALRGDEALHGSDPAIPPAARRRRRRISSAGSTSSTRWTSSRTPATRCSIA